MCQAQIFKDQTWNHAFSRAKWQQHGMRSSYLPKARHHQHGSADTIHEPKVTAEKCWKMLIVNVTKISEDFKIMKKSRVFPNFPNVFNPTLLVYLENFQGPGNWSPGKWRINFAPKVEGSTRDGNAPVNPGKARQRDHRYIQDVTVENIPRPQKKMPRNSSTFKGVPNGS